jgi:predicted MFS family arabinose efflux permease
MLGNIDAFGGPALPLWIVPLGMVLAAPIWGYLSDRRGRRLVLLVSMLGLMITSAIPMLVPNPNRLYLGLLLVSIFYSGLLPVSLAYASDLSDEKKRAGAVGLLAAAFTLASLGPQLLGYNAPPIFAVSSAVLALGLAFVFLKEPSGSRPTVASSFLDGTRRSISALWGVFLVALLGIAWLQSPPLTEIGAHFGLSYFGYPSIIVVFIAIFLQAVLLRPLIGRWGEKSLIRVSLLVGVLAIILNISMSFYINPYTTVISLGFLVLAGKVAEPTVFTLISKRSQQGTGLALGLGSGFLILGGWINQLLQDQIQQSFGINATAMLVIFMLLLAFGVSFWALKRV